MFAVSQSSHVSPYHLVTFSNDFLDEEISLTGVQLVGRQPCFLNDLNWALNPVYTLFSLAWIVHIG